MDGKQPLPEGFLCSLTAYLISDSTGMEATIDISNLPWLPNISPDVGAADLMAEMLGDRLPALQQAAEDIRFMSKKEVIDYLARQKEEKRQADAELADHLDRLETEAAG